jgi:hypothetical protein
VSKQAALPAPQRKRQCRPVPLSAVLKNRNGSLAKVPILVIAALSFYYASAYARWQAHSTPFYGVFVTEQQFRDELPHIIAQGLATKRVQGLATKRVQS